MKLRVMVAVGFFAFLAVMAVYGQPDRLKVKIDFPFTVEGKTLPAGSYEFARDSSASVPVFRVTDQGKNQVMVQVLTRLAAKLIATPEDAHLVFDKVGETYVLAEIWIPGEDGYALAVTKAKHEHKIVKVKY